MSSMGSKSDARAAQAASQPLWSASRRPSSAASVAAARFGVAAMPPKATRACGDAARLDGEPEGAQQAGNVLVEALGDLVAAEDLPGREARHVDPGHELARSPVLLAVVDEEVLERHGPRRIEPAQVQCRAERDQGGHRIADRGAVGDVAAERPHGADLLAAETAEQLKGGRDRSPPWRSRPAHG